jgi:hypothetical protein
MLDQTEKVTGETIKQSYPFGNPDPDPHPSESPIRIRIEVKIQALQSLKMELRGAMTLKMEP